MAFCPSCKKEIPMMARSCEHCGYDFPSKTERTDTYIGWAYGKFATAAITVAQAICALYVVVGLIASVVALFHLELLVALAAFLASIVSFGLVAALSRIQDLR